MRIEIGQEYMVVDGRRFPDLRLAPLVEVFGEPRFLRPSSSAPDGSNVLPNTLVLWDSAGVWAYTKDEIVAEELAIRLARDPEWETRPTHDSQRWPSSVFVGSLLVNGRQLIDVLPEEEIGSAHLGVEIVSDAWHISASLTRALQVQIMSLPLAERTASAEVSDISQMLREAPDPFREVSISLDSDVFPDEGLTPPAAESRILHFDNFPLKLAVLQQLVYEQVAIGFPSELTALLASKSEKVADGTEAERSLLVQKRFAKLAIPVGLCQAVEELTLDGGNEIYLQLAPQWDGEDGRFDIDTISAEELAQLPRLARVFDIGGFLGPEARAMLVARGVEVSS